MSYQRFGDDSDVYVYRDVYGYFNCCMCGLENGKDKHYKTIKGMINHLKKHKKVGHKGTKHAIEGLEYALNKKGNHWKDH